MQEKEVNLNKIEEDEGLEITLYEDKKVEKPLYSDIKRSIDTIDFEEDRYSRLRLITWWDQEKLLSTKMMIVGAGAIGNELLKNAALLGIGNLFVVDFDTIENSNLSRSVLFRETDERKSKAEISAKRVREINPSINVQAFNADIVHDIGLGVFRRMDIVMGGLDNREARLAINQSCWKVNTPWIDGAIEVLHGVARVFVPPDSACYECTMNELDYKLLEIRKSCALLRRDDLLQGKVPTTPTTASIIAGIQMQEAVKLIHKRPEIPTLTGKGFIFDGVSHSSYIVEYPRKKDCGSHITYDNIIELDKKAEETTVGEMLGIVRQELGTEAILEFEREIVCKLICPNCNGDEPIFRALGKITEKEAKCPKCGKIRRYESTHSISGDEEFLDKTLWEIGIPSFDILSGRVGLEKFACFELTGDKEKMLGTIIS